MTDNIHQALFALQGLLRGVQKDAKNPHFKNSYASFEQVTDTIRPHFQALGLYWSQQPGAMVSGSIEVTTQIVHAATGEKMAFTMQIPLAKQDPQGAGSALTYAMRYSLMAALGLPPTDDDAETAIDRGNKRPEPQKAEVQEQDTQATVSLWNELTSLTTHAGLISFWKDNAATIAGMSKASKEKFTAEKDRLKSKFSSARDTVKDIQDTFPGARVVNETHRELHNLEAGE